MHERKIVLTPAFVARFLSKKKPAVATVIPTSFSPVATGIHEIKGPLVRA